MVYCDQQKTKHNETSLCTFYIHYSRNSKKNSQKQPKSKTEDSGSFIPSLPLSCRSHLLELQVYCAHWKPYSDSISAKNNITDSWHLQNCHGKIYGPDCGTLFLNQKQMEDCSSHWMIASILSLERKFMHVNMSSIMQQNKISQNIRGHKMWCLSVFLKSSRGDGHACHLQFHTTIQKIYPDPQTEIQRQKH